jgi:cytochrome c oxidase subunit 3/cytochrome o ubiquinol oxidase subunit 3
MASSPSALELTPEQRGRVGMLAFLTAEAVFFATFIVVYLFYLGSGDRGPSPREILRVPWIGTVCLVTSSVTVWAAHRSAARGSVRGLAFWMSITAALAIAFLAGTGLEWHRMIENEGFWIDTNLFGTTFYSLVGFHALHVAIGLVGLVTVAALAWANRVDKDQAQRVELVSWYWHFVDSVWLVVFGVVYWIGRGA